MNPRMLIDGVEHTQVAACDRGLLYGDGLFETLRVRAGLCPLWSLHLQRLLAGCERLGLPLPEAGVLERERDALIAGIDDAVLRITWTRGCGVRGYAPPARVKPTRILALTAVPTRSAHPAHCMPCQYRPAAPRTRSLQSFASCRFPPG
ncbi:MAG: aminotransferase class IV [Metallibacterium sp.]